MVDYTSGEQDKSNEDPIRTRERLDQIEKAQAITDEKITMLTERVSPILPPALANGAGSDFGSASEAPALSEIDMRLERITRKAEEQGSAILTLMNRINL